MDVSPHRLQTQSIRGSVTHGTARLSIPRVPADVISSGYTTMDSSGRTQRRGLGSRQTSLPTLPTGFKTRTRTVSTDEYGTPARSQSQGFWRSSKSDSSLNSTTRKNHHYNNAHGTWSSTPHTMAPRGIAVGERNKSGKGKHRFLPPSSNGKKGGKKFLAYGGSDDVPPDALYGQLMSAAQQNDVGSIRDLLCYPSLRSMINRRLEVTDSSGVTEKLSPLEVAAQNDALDAAQALVRYGHADINPMVVVKTKEQKAAAATAAAAAAALEAENPFLKTATSNSPYKMTIRPMSSNSMARLSGRRTASPSRPLQTSVAATGANDGIDDAAGAAGAAGAGSVDGYSSDANNDLPHSPQASPKRKKRIMNKSAAIAEDDESSHHRSTLPVSGSAFLSHGAMSAAAAAAAAPPPKQYKPAGSPLYHACHRGSLNVARWLLASGANISYKLPRTGYTPFTIVASMATQGKGLQYVELVEMLLAHNANVESKLPGAGCSPLMAACEMRQVPLIKKLILAGADCNIYNARATPELSTPLACAAVCGVASTVALLVQQGKANPNFLLPEQKLNSRSGAGGDGGGSGSSGSSRNNVIGGCTALHCAVKANKLPTAAWLVHEGGASLRIATTSKDFAIHIACRQGHIDILRWLSQLPKFNPNVRRPTTGGTADTPLHIAASGGHLELVAFLAEKCECNVSPRLGPGKAGFSPLHCAIEGGHKAVVRYLVDKAQADVEGRGEKIIVKASLEDTKDNLRSAFVPDMSMVGSMAASSGSPADGSVSPQSSKRRQSQLVTPLIWATIEGELSIANTLLGLGRSAKRPLFGAAPSSAYVADTQPYANPNGTESRSGQTALHYACRIGRIDMAKLLIKGRADPEVICVEKKVSPLFRAIESGHIAIVRFLIEVVGVNANFDGYVERDLPPIRIALQNGHGLVARYLEQHGAANADQDRRFSLNTRVFLRTIDDESAEKLHAISGVSNTIRGLNSIVDEDLQCVAAEYNARGNVLVDEKQHVGNFTTENGSNPKMAKKKKYYEPVMTESVGVLDFEQYDSHRIRMDAINHIQVMDDTDDESDFNNDEVEQKIADGLGILPERKRTDGAAFESKSTPRADAGGLLGKEKVEADEWRLAEEEKARENADEAKMRAEQDELVADAEDTDQLGVVKSILEATEAGDAKAAARAGSAKGRRDKRVIGKEVAEEKEMAITTHATSDATAYAAAAEAAPHPTTAGAAARPTAAGTTAAGAAAGATARPAAEPLLQQSRTETGSEDTSSGPAAAPQDEARMIAELKAQNERDDAVDRALAEQADKLAIEAKAKKMQLAKESREQKAVALAAESAKLAKQQKQATAAREDPVQILQQKEWLEEDARDKIVMHRLTHKVLEQSNQNERPIVETMRRRSSKPNSEIPNKLGSI